jgi:hypothetical protein
MALGDSVDESHDADYQREVIQDIAGVVFGTGNEVKYEVFYHYF